MAEDQFSRTRLLIGQDGIEALSRARVAVFGIGGVGGYVCEALARSGIGAFDLIDMDTVSITNLNRQIIATHASLGKPKTLVMKERMLDINPRVDIRIHDCFFLPETAPDFHFEEFDYVIDAVDTVTAKIEIILRAQRASIPVISSMGAGNRLDPSRFRVADIYQTSVCPLAKVMRRELKQRGVKALKVVYSDEQPTVPQEVPGETSGNGKSETTGIETTGIIGSKTIKKASGNTLRKGTLGSMPFVPGACGLVIASEVVKDLVIHDCL